MFLGGRIRVISPRIRQPVCDSIATIISKTSNNVYFALFLSNVLYKLRFFFSEILVLYIGVSVLWFPLIIWVIIGVGRIIKGSLDSYPQALISRFFKAIIHLKVDIFGKIKCTKCALIRYDFSFSGTFLTICWSSLFTFWVIYTATLAC